MPELENKIFRTPIVLLTFNRPHTTQRVFQEIKKIKPQKLFIASDGPRKNNKEDVIKCQQVREIMEQVDWNCEVHTFFREKNLGGPISNSSAISWFFENISEGIVLEDDCLPNQTFFWYCQELLEKYRNNDKIKCINGSNFKQDKKINDHSYYFSVFNHSWGWASWSRAWAHWNKDYNKNFNDFKKNKKIKKITKNKNYQKYWMSIFQKIYDGKINNWDYIWIFSCWSHNGLACTPCVNLVSNIGFGADAQHTKNLNDERLNKPNYAIGFPLKHPTKIEANKKNDNYINKHFFKIKSQNKIVLIATIFLKNILKKMKIFYIVKKFLNI